MNDLQAYVIKARALWEKKGQSNGIFDASTIDSFPMFEEGLTHAENVAVRLNMIIFLLDCCERELTVDFCNLRLIRDMLTGE